MVEPNLPLVGIATDLARIRPSLGDTDRTWAQVVHNEPTFDHLGGNFDGKWSTGGLSGFRQIHGGASVIFSGFQSLACCELSAARQLAREMLNKQSSKASPDILDPACRYERRVQATEQSVATRTDLFWTHAHALFDRLRRFFRHRRLAGWIRRVIRIWSGVVEAQAVRRLARLDLAPAGCEEGRLWVCAGCQLRGISKEERTWGSNERARRTNGVAPKDVAGIGLADLRLGR